MHWNHRIVRTHDEGRPVYQFAEVFYHDETNELKGWSNMFTVSETVDGLRDLVLRLQRASLLPVIDENEFPMNSEDIIT